MLKRWLSVFAVPTLAYSSAPAQEARVDIGHLICGFGEGAEVESCSDALTGEPRKILCAFRPSNSEPEEVYAAPVQTIGQDLQRSRDKAMIWVVKASPATQRSIGLLQRLYAADRSAPSILPPRLIGETSGAIVLQTLADAEVLTRVDKQSGAVASVPLIARNLLSSPA